MNEYAVHYLKNREKKKAKGMGTIFLHAALNDNTVS